MDNETKFTPLNIDNVMAEKRMLERVRAIVEYGIKHALTAREVRDIINREMNRLETLVALQNETAREEYIRRRLGLSDQDIVTDAHVFEAFEIRQHHEITMNAIKRGGQRGVYLRANKERAVAHKFNQYRYIRFLNKRARKRLNTKLFRVQPYPK